MSATVKDVMTTEVVAVRKDTSFKEMAALLRQHRVSAFPVIDDHGKVVGVVSEADLLAKEALVAGGGLQPGPISQLRHRKEFSKAGAVTVKNGVVTLEGRPETADSGHAIVAAVWHVEGVVSVRDRLEYPPAHAHASIMTPGPLL